MRIFFFSSLFKSNIEYIVQLFYFMRSFIYVKWYHIYFHYNVSLSKNDFIQSLSKTAKTTNDFIIYFSNPDINDSKHIDLHKYRYLKLDEYNPVKEYLECHDKGMKFIECHDYYRGDFERFY